VVPAEAVETADATFEPPDTTDATATAVPVDSADVTGDAFQAFETTDTLVEQPAPTAPAAPTGTVYITGTDGDGAACRGEASYGAPSLATLPEGTLVDALGDATGEWQPVACGGGTGYVNGAYVSWETADAAPPTLESLVDESLVDRAETESTAPEVTMPPAEEAAEPATTEEPVIAAPVEAEEPAAAEAAPVAAPAGGGSGQAIANFAMQFVGYPYSYGGASPAGFDCSGFTMYVVQQTLGMSIPHDTASQAGVGTPVGKGELQPGDLVYFQNTFAPGVSHAGVYIGGGQFVHAENEATGVKVSDVNSSYYAEHWYGATRLA
jgi:cell wall-associated NlpC family hydrolase